MITSRFFGYVCLVLLCGVLVASSSIAQESITEPPRLWVAEQATARQFQPEIPNFEQVLPLAPNPKALALDPGTRNVWIRSEGTMLLFDAEGTYQLGWPLAPRGPGKSHLTTVPTDGSLWLGEDKRLEAWGIGGLALHQRDFPGRIQALDLDPERNILWVLTTARLVALHAMTGEEQLNISLQGQKQALAVDPFTGEVWVGTNQELLLFSPDGETLAHSPRSVDHLAAVTDGEKLLGLWVVDGTDITFIDPELRELFALQPFGDTPQDRITGLALDPHTGSAWVTDGRRLAEVSPGGSNVVRYDLGEGASVEALLVQRLERLPHAPSVEILQPTEGQGFAAPRPEVKVRFSPGDFEPVPETLELRAGGFTLEVECTPEGNDRLVCVPVDELPEGNILLSATVADSEGLRSEPDVVSFRVEAEEAEQPTAPHNDTEVDDPASQPTYTPSVSPRGIRPNTPFVPGSDIDVVDTTSGNLTVRVPIGQRYEVGPLLGYQIQAVYNSNTWESHEVLCASGGCGAGDEQAQFALTNPNSNAGLGWELHFGRLYAPLPPSGMSSVDAQRWPNRDLAASDGGRFMYVAPDGAVHYLYNLTDRENGTNQRPVRYSKDGTFLRMQQTSDTQIKLEFPNGLVSYFERSDAVAGTNFCGNGVTGCWRFARTEDYYGNNMSVSYTLANNKETWTVTDSTNRYHKIVFSHNNATRAGNDCTTSSFCTPEGDEWGDLRRVLTQVRVAAFGGQLATYNFVTVPQQISRGCPHDAVYLPTGTDKITVPLLTEIRPPLGQPYKFNTLGPNGTGAGCLSGKLDEITLPTRGGYRYDYGWWYMPTRCSYHNAPDAESEFPVRGIRRRERLNTDGTVQADWQYSSALYPGITSAQLSGADCERAQYRITTVDGPKDGDDQRVRTKHYNAVYQGPKNPTGSAPLTGWQVTDHGLPYSKNHTNSDTDGLQFLSNEVFLCGTDSNGDASSCVKKRSTYRRYTMEFERCGKAGGDGAGCFKINPQVEREKVIFHDDGNRWVKTWNQQPDGVGHFRRVLTKDNFTVTAGETARTVETNWITTNVTLPISTTTGHLDEGDPTTYLPSPSERWFLGDYNRQKRTEPSSGRTYTSLFKFNSEGTLRCTRHFKGASASSNDLVIELVRGSAVGTNAGLPIQEIVAGGDTPGANLPTAGACAGSGGSAADGSRYVLQHEFQHYQLSKTYLSGFPNWYRATIDRNTGLPSATYNPQDQGTTHTYDLFGRLTTSFPDASLLAANLYITYTNPANADPSILERLQKYGGQLTWKRSTYDAFGRPIKEEQRRPTGLTTYANSERIHAYDTAGHLRKTSNWQDSATHDRDKATFYKSRDAFGRPRRIERPDGEVQTLGYFGERRTNSTVRIRTAATAFSNVTTSEVKDALGRTLKSVTPLYTTQFFYDPNGQQIQSKRGTQNRYYGYDARGFLLSERHPETGPNGNGTLTYTRDAFGQLRHQSHGNRDLTYLYDNGGRLTTIKDAQNRIWKEWTWATANSGTNYRKGKITQAKRHNYPLNNAINWTVIEDYEYRGVSGALSQKKTKIRFPHANQTTPTFTQSATYDPLGNRATLTYPQCTATACTGGDDLSAPNHTVTTTHNQGLAIDVTSSRGPSGTYSYHPNFQLSQLEYSNNVTGTFTQGTNGMSRPTQISYKKGSGSPFFNTGTMKYDGAGNLYQIGSDSYTYDATSRLTWGTVTQAGSRWETYQYDAFDNITSAQKENLTPVPFTVNTANNRYLGDPQAQDMLYDSTGNLIQLGAPNWTLTWDAFDMQTNFTSLVNPQSNHLYAYGPGDYRIITLDTDLNELTWHLRDTDGTILREYTVTGSGAAEFWNTWEHKKDYIHGPEGTLASITRTGTQHFLHKDHLGTPRAITDRFGNVQGRHDYYPFGEETPRTGQVDEPMVKFTGHQRDAHGLSDYMLGRTCLWPLRRFASVDPARDGWNLYAYVGNDPINKVDPTGYLADTAVDLLFLAADGAIATYEYITTGEVSETTKAATALDAMMLFIPGATGGGMMYRLANGTAETAQAVKAVRQSGEVAQMATKAGQVGDASTNAMESRGGGGGRTSNHLKPDPDASGPHSTRKTDADGNVTGHAEWDANGHPVQRTDVDGRSHNGVSTPHTHEYGPPNTNPHTGQTFPGRETHVRPARPEEIPRQRSGG